MPFEYERDWEPTELSPDTVPINWMQLLDAFYRFRDEAGVADLAVADLRRALCANRIQSMALRKLKADDGEVWHQRMLPVGFWRAVRLFATIDLHGNETVGLRPPDWVGAKSLGRGPWSFHLCRADVDVLFEASASPQIHQIGSTSTELPGDITPAVRAVVKALYAFEKEGVNLIGVRKDDLAQMIATHLGVPVSKRTLQRAEAYRRNRAKAVPVVQSGLFSPISADQVRILARSGSVVNGLFVHSTARQCMVLRMAFIIDPSSYDADTISEFAIKNRISRSQVFKEIAEGRLIASKVGTRTIITRENGAAWRRALPTSHSATNK